MFSRMLSAGPDGGGGPGQHQQLSGMAIDDELAKRHVGTRESQHEQYATQGGPLPPNHLLLLSDDGCNSNGPMPDQHNPN